jgi:hypothetical protein
MYVIDVLTIFGLETFIKLVWDYLENTYDGGIQVSTSDSVIAFILTLVLWWNIRKWIIIKDTENQIKR